MTPRESPDDVVKRRADAHPNFFPAEAAGLAWLADGGARTARVIEVDREHIRLERVPSARPTREAAEEFGRMLARTHAAGARGFGCPPDGIDGTLFIGNRTMTSTVHASWGEFYAAERVLPYLRVAVDAGTVTADEAALVERACALVASGVVDPVGGADRVHGDLWTGNVLWSPDGVVLIDPAAHGGHRETDLAMLALFGCPFLTAIHDGYRDVGTLDDGWEDRTPIHQLHPLAVHAAGHGRSYGESLATAAAETVRLLG